MNIIILSKGQVNTKEISEFSHVILSKNEDLFGKADFIFLFGKAEDWYPTIIQTCYTATKNIGNGWSTSIRWIIALDNETECYKVQEYLKKQSQYCTVIQQGYPKISTLLLL